MDRRNESHDVPARRAGRSILLLLLFGELLASRALAQVPEAPAEAEAAAAGCPAADPTFEDFPDGPDAPRPASPPRKLFDARTTRVFLLVPFAVVPAVGYVSWWKRDFGVRFHTVAEGWFGRDTYAGGADKVSHFYWGTVGQEALSEAFRKLGHPEGEARALAAANVLLSSFVVEVGDAMTSYGFTWEDAAATVAGAGAYALISSRGLQDTIGFRFGIVPDFERPAEASTSFSSSRRFRVLSREPDASVPARYSQELYTMDLRFKGLLPRLKKRPGLARFLFLSLTYGTKGYKSAPPEQRERNIGLELGLSFSEVFRAVGVKETTWWGNALLIFLDHFRVPYSAFGIRYDLNSRRWFGPDGGNIYDRGPGR